MNDYKLREMQIRTVVVGTGAAGFRAAAQLIKNGVTDLAVVAEGVNHGTSRNTGSDKQTYYKLSLAGGDDDSVRKLAEDLFAGQCTDGDTALCEAALSAQSFYHLVSLGVPFPCNEYGEFIGYKTDHDRGKRATSAGPYTSKLMTEALEQEVRGSQVPILDRLQVIKLLVADERISGLLCLDKSNQKHLEYVVIWCENVVFATGGPAGMYQDSVYPISQLGSSGIAFAAGVKGKNLTEWQFGMASLKPRWNVSGTYMQVLPRFISTNQDGSEEREFLADYFADQAKMLSMIFLKGYQWPFDTNKVFGGSSVIDLLVYQERFIKGRRVFLDFKENPGKAEIPYQHLANEAAEYLRQAGACFGTPIERLAHMNEPAIQFYRDHGVDLYSEVLEIAICAQHNNGGLAADCNWETNISGLFAVGEVCGSHGVTRPGGTALNAGQAGALRAAGKITHTMKQNQTKIAVEVQKDCLKQAQEHIQMLLTATGATSVKAAWTTAAARMSRCAGMIRNQDELMLAMAQTKAELEHFTAYVSVADTSEAGFFYHLHDMLIAQTVYLSAMLDYISHNGGSRGSALYTCPDGEKPDDKLPDIFACRLDQGQHGTVIQEVQLVEHGCEFHWRPVRPLPEPDYFFETQWRVYREIFR